MLYPAPFRIGAGDPRAGLLILELAAIKEMAGALPPSERPEPIPEPVSGTLDKDFAVSICNQMLRLQRSAQKARQQGAGEAERLQGHLERLRKLLEDQGVEYEDLTGQTYDPGRSDFEPLGEPQLMPELRRDTIVQCERPVVLLKGKPVQKAKGIVGTPAG